MLSLCILLSATLIPLEFHPQFDTWETFDARATAETKSSGYAGYIAHEESEALDEEYEVTYRVVEDHFKQDTKALRKELEACELSPAKVEEVLLFREREAKRLEAEEEAWHQWWSLEHTYCYQQYIEGTARLVAPLFVSNFGTFQRIQILRNRFASLFSSELKTKHLWGDWDSELHDMLIFGRGIFQECWLKEVKGKYALNQGVLSIQLDQEKTSRPYWITISGGETALFLNLHDPKVVELPDIPFCKMIETILIKQVEQEFQNRLEALDHWIEECLAVKDPEADFYERWAGHAEEEKELLKKTQMAWEKWREIAFTDAMQLLPDGTSFFMSHSPEHNQILVKRIMDLQDLPIDSPLVPELVIGRWECLENDEVWEFRKEGEHFFYEVFQKGFSIEKGIYLFREGLLKLFAIESQRKPKPVIKLTEKEAQIYRNYLFGPLKRIDTFQKLSS